MCLLMYMHIDISEYLEKEGMIDGRERNEPDSS